MIRLDYDSRGNITSETRNGNITTYEYDALGQLVRVNDPIDNTAFGAGGIDQPGTTWIYRYDHGGNILAKEIYDYTTGTVGAVIRTISFAYGDTNWKDKLTVFDNTYLFTYGSTDAEKKRHLPRTATTPEGVKTTTTYDSYGNALTSKIQETGTSPLIQTETEYTSDGNYVVKQKDARGNTVESHLCPYFRV